MAGDHPRGGTAPVRAHLKRAAAKVKEAAKLVADVLRGVYYAIKIDDELS